MISFLLLTAACQIHTVCIYVKNSDQECDAKVRYKGKYNMSTDEGKNAFKDLYNTVNDGDELNITYSGYSEDEFPLPQSTESDTRSLLVKIGPRSSCRQDRLGNITLNNPHYTHFIKLSCYKVNFNDVFSAASLTVENCTLAPVHLFGNQFYTLQSSFSFYTKLMNAERSEGLPEDSDPVTINNLKLQEDKLNDSPTSSERQITISDSLEIFDTNLYSIKVQDSVQAGMLKVEITQDSATIAFFLPVESLKSITFKFIDNVPDSTNLLTFEAGGSTPITSELKDDFKLYIQSNSKNPYMNIKVSSSVFLSKVKGGEVNLASTASNQYPETATLKLINDGSSALDLVGLEMKIVNAQITTQGNINFGKLTAFYSDNNNLLTVSSESGNPVISFTDFDEGSAQVNYGDGNLKDIYSILNLKISKSATLTLQKAKLRGQNLNIKLVSFLESEKMVYGNLKIGQLLNANNQIKDVDLKISYEMPHPNKQLNNEEVTNYFGESSYAFFNYLGSTNLKFHFQPESNHPGFIPGQSILKVTETSNAYNLTYDTERYKSLPTVFCFALTADNEKCDTNAIVFNYDSDINIKTNTGKTSTLLTDKLNYILEFVDDDRTEVKFNYIITDYAYSNFKYETLKLDFSKLKNNKNYEIRTGTDFLNSPKIDFDHIDASIEGSKLIIRSFKLPSDKEYNPKFNMVFERCNFESQALSDGKYKMNNKIECIFAYTDLIYQFAGETKISRQFKLDKSHIIVNGIQPLHIHNITYTDNDFLISLRSVAIDNIVAYNNTFGCTDLTLNVEYSTDDNSSMNVEFVQYGSGAVKLVYESITNKTDYPKLIIPNFVGGITIVSAENASWPDAFRNTQSLMINLNQSAMTQDDAGFGKITAIITDLTSPNLGFSTNGKYKASDDLVYYIRTHDADLQLGDTNSLVLFDELVMDSYFYNTVKVGIKGCIVEVESLEIKYKTPAEFDGLNVKGTMKVYPGATIKHADDTNSPTQPESPSQPSEPETPTGTETNPADPATTSRSIREEAPSQQPAFCDIFGHNETILLWNSNDFPSITLPEGCKIDRDLVIKFKYDDSLLSQSINATSFIEKYIKSSAEIIKNLEFQNGHKIITPPESTFLRPDFPTDQYSAVDPNMSMSFEGGILKIKASSDFNQEKLNYIKAEVPRPSDLQKNDFVYFKDNKSNGLPILIALFVVVVVIIIAAWIYMHIKFGYTLKQESSSGSYTTGSYVSEKSKKSDSSSSRKKRRLSSSDSASL